MTVGLCSVRFNRSRSSCEPARRSSPCRNYLPGERYGGCTTYRGIESYTERAMTISVKIKVYSDYV